MYIKNLQFINFRNYKQLNLELNKRVNIFIGDNAQGKTNILEGIYYCGFAKSHRTSKDKELINWDGENAYLQVYIKKNRIDKKIQIKIFKQGKKGVNINSIKIAKMSELIGTFNVVMFSPEDLKIIKDSPSYRRKFLDMEISQLNKKYYYSLVQYNKVLNERNIVLKKWDGNKGIIDIYNEQLSKFGAYIISERLKYIKKLNDKGQIIHKDITQGRENIVFKYMSSIEKFDNIQNDLLSSLNYNLKNDLYKGITTVGPHRDDFKIEINNINMRNFGSQGQQRTSILTIKFASVEIIKDEVGEYPVLLLDDVLSELDINRQKYILNSLDKVQTIITCTGINNIKDYIEDDTYVFCVQEGILKRISFKE